MARNKPIITVGADPEFFLEAIGVSYNSVRSAIGMVGGTKEDPRPLGREGFFVQEDNVAVEFNIPPAKTMEEFVESIEWSVNTITKNVKELALAPRITAAELFPEPELRNPLARSFGCNPDFNAWTNDINPRPLNVSPFLRTSGGHIHVALTGSAIAAWVIDFVKAMDLYVGVPSVMMDTDTTRRQLYGKAGAFRRTPYGSPSWEYRVLSNFWIKQRSLIEWAYEQTIRAVNFVLTTPEAELNKLWTSIEEDVRRCINHSDLDLSQKLIQYHDLKTA